MKKILICITVILSVFLLIPTLVLTFANSDFGMGLFFILFFAINPVTIAVIGYISAAEIKKLWYMPLIASALFPLLHAVAIWDKPVWELYTYSLGYAIIGYAAMLISFLISKFISKKSK